MKDFYFKYNTKHSWLIKEEGWVKSLQGVRESQFALGNGFLGSRAILEEVPYDSRPGTYIAGLYDKIGSQVSELVNLPNPFNFKIVADGEKLGVGTMKVAEHERTLNLENGLLCRKTVFSDRKKRRYDLQTMRFLSMHNINVGVMQVVFTPLDEDVKISVETGLDTSVYNAGTVTEGRKKHFRIKELEQLDNEGYLVAETFGKLHKVIIRSGFYYQISGSKILAKDNVFELKLHKDQTVVFTKIFHADIVPKEDDLEKRKKLSEKQFRKAFQGSFSSLLKNHIRAFRVLWDTAEVAVWGDPEVEKNLNFNIYHMLISAPKNEGLSSIGAKALSGEGYRGHVFWDTEIFLLPFYVYTLPEAAKNMLIYRYKRLDAARENAAKNGYKGAMFPWESAGLGHEETPAWAKDLDGKVIRIHTGEMEHHITADIAYAAYHYYNVTKDERFLREYGYELFFETARFWASRVTYNKRKKKYDIKHTIGPDEFHTDVNNNAFTNTMAKWNLLTSYKLYQKLKKSYPEAASELASKINLSKNEPKKWKVISSGLSLKTSKKGVIEQFDGYFKKKYVKIDTLDENSLPVPPGNLTPRGYKDTQLVKQADVVMLLYLLSDVFSLRTKKRNYEYYTSRTLHKSSLSLPMYAIVGIAVGDRARAYRFFNLALHTDINNIHNNTNKGVHSACMGGTWQTLINGFAGVSIEKETLSVDPKLPKGWRRLLFSIFFRGNLIKFEVGNNSVKLRMISQNKKRKRIKIKIFGHTRDVSAGKPKTFRRKKTAREKRSYYL